MSKNDPFFMKLTPNLQRSFGSRLMNFLDYKDFQTREGLRLTTEMKLVISSAAVRITFGLRNYEFSLFHTIIIFPDEYYSNYSQQLVKGETSATGVIIFSWNDLKYGNSIPNDSINLGYHEFAHALFFEHLMEPYNNSFKDHYREWLRFVKYNHKLEEAVDKHIFRDYAATNEMEFFAVALENFFERPDHFKEGLPQLYSLMSEMLNQDLVSK
ncbi:MAG: zinc-dependent peptidase [Bacteroidetes bacterium]|nr:zinc-dependent peptidase [Bacteroidota bacterium]